MKERLVLLGPPASGKGTQAELLAERYQLPITSPGAMLREELRSRTDLGIRAELHTSKGMLLPDEVVVGLVKSWLEKQNTRFIFDGFPRSLGQADALDSLLMRRGAPLDAVIALDAPRETLEERVVRRIMCTACGRSLSIGLHINSPLDPCPACGGILARRLDDTPEALAIRLREYADKTEPLISYYATKGLLYRVESDSRPEVVFQAIRAIIEGE